MGLPIEPMNSSSIQIPVQDVSNQSLIFNWYSRTSLEASDLVAQACIPLHELLKNVSRNLDEKVQILISEILLLSLKMQMTY